MEQAIRSPRCGNKYISKQKIESIKEIKIKEFNYKILNNILLCGVNLKQWRLIDDDSCIFCQHAHAIPPLLFSCNLTNTLWNIISTILGIRIDVEAIVFGLTNNLKLNNILSILGYSIYKYWLVYKDETAKGNVMVHNIQKYKQYIQTELRYKIKVYELVEHMDHSIGDMMINIVCSL